MKRFVSLLLILALCLCAVGCGATAQPEQTQSLGWHSEGDIQITQEQVESIVNGEFTAAKNVILLIGDGMGANDIQIAADHASGLFDFGLVLEQLPHHGLSTTYSADNQVTDSAASGTALSTGVKTNNGYLGKGSDLQDLKVMAETAREAGKKVGIVTDDYLTGATPAAFSVHNESRENDQQIITDMLAFAPDVLIGKYDLTHLLAAEKLGYLTAAKVADFSETLDTAEDLTKPFVGFNEGNQNFVSNELAYCAQTALKLLDNENGFFLMIESCGTDKAGHSNNIRGKMAGVATLDRTLAAVLLFMQQNPDTLLIVTSDHETGGVQLPQEGEAVSALLFTTEEHTDTMVRVFALGQGSEYFSGKTVDNTDIGNYIKGILSGQS